MRRRALGWALVLYGVAGIILILVGATVALDMAGRIERLTLAADGALGAATASTRSASVAFESVDSNLSESQASAAGAADLARDASVTLDALSRAMEVSILGAQPLIGLADDFATSADQAEELGDTLDRVGSSLDGTRDDVSSIGADLDLLADELDGLRAETGSGSAPPPIRPFVLLLLAWLLIPALGGLVAGVTLIGVGRRRDPVVRVSPPDA